MEPPEDLYMYDDTVASPTPVFSYELRRSYTFPKETSGGWRWNYYLVWGSGISKSVLSALNITPVQRQIGFALSEDDFVILKLAKGQ